MINPDLVKVVGGDIPMPSNAISIVAGNSSSVTFTVTQIWDDVSIELLAVHYNDHIGSSICARSAYATAGTTMTYTAVCYDGWTDISIYLFIGSGLDINECESCQPPGDNDWSADVAYYFELPCHAVCEDNSPGTISPHSIVTESPVQSPMGTITPTKCSEEMKASEVYKMGANVPLPREALKIISQNGDTVDFTITQTWVEGILSMYAVQYHRAMGSTDCDKQTNVTHAMTSTFKAVCFGGYTEVNLFVYVGDDFDEDACEACQTPLHDDPNVVSYYFELACERTCDKHGPNEPSIAPFDSPTSLPTGCVDGTVEQDFNVGADIGFEVTLRVSDHIRNTVQFVVESFWADDVSMVAVHYDSSIGSSQCEVLDPALLNSKLFSAVCYGSVAQVSLFIHKGEVSSESSCFSCSEPSMDSPDVAKLYFEVPCAEICTVTESYEETVRADCFDGASLRNVEGNCGYYESPIEIVLTENDSVTFTVKHTWNVTQNSGHFVNDLSQIAVRYVPYPAETGQHICTSDHFVVPGFEQSYKARCNADGVAEVQIFVSDDAFDVNADATLDGECSPSNEGTKNCAYSFVLPCRVDMLCSPLEHRKLRTSSDHVCVDAGIRVVEADVHLPLPDGVVSAECYNPDSSVTFRVNQIWEMNGFDSWFAAVYTDAEGDLVCKQVDQINYDSSTLHASKCVDGVSSIDFYVHDPSVIFESLHQVPNVCKQLMKSADSVALHRFEFSCSSTGPCGELQTDICAVQHVEDLENSEAFTAFEAEGAVYEPNGNEEDIPYCVSEDFPCEGEGHDMVYVCHYSARKGYQTFCIPETDSDILRFYPNDYCGPCEGGYGGLWN
jgi:hypothetical protein